MGWLVVGTAPHIQKNDDGRLEDVEKATAIQEGGRVSDSTEC